jgi:hypothetical protein
MQEAFSSGDGCVPLGSFLSFDRVIFQKLRWIFPLSSKYLQPNWIAVDPEGRFLAVVHFGGVGDEALRILEIDSLLRMLFGR